MAVRLFIDLMIINTKYFLTGEFHNDPYADDDHGWRFNGYTVNRLDDQFFLGKDILVAPIDNPGYFLSFC